MISNKINIFKTIKKSNSGFANNDTLSGTLKSLRNWKKSNLKQLKKNAIICFKKNFQVKYAVKNFIHQLKNKLITKIFNK